MDKMEEGFSTDDDLRPDTSDRRPSRARKSSRVPSMSVPKVTVSRQHLIMGIGIMVLLLILISIGSALKSPGKTTQSQQTTDNARNINLSDSSSLSSNNNGVVHSTMGTNDGSAANNSAQNSGQPQNLSGQPVSSSPTQATPVQQPANQQRVNLPGNLSDALSSPQAQNDVNNSIPSTLPTAPATLASRGAGNTVSTASVQNVRPVQTTRPAAVAQDKKPAKTGSAKTTTSRNTTTRPAKATTSTISRGAVAGSSSASFKSAPGSYYTLQLSGASRSDTLNAFAKRQNLSQYLVYETTRDGKPWYVLVSGIYANSSAAKKAVSTLPADVQAKQPWAKPLNLVQKDIK